MGAMARPPLEQVNDVIVAPAPPPAEPLAAPPPPTLKQRLRGAFHAVDRSRRGRWVKKVIAFPIGERFAAISLSAALFDARVTFVVLLAWGGLAGCYALAARTLRSLGRHDSVALDPGAAPAGALVDYRDDGPIALALGRLRAPAVPALAVVLVALAPAAVAIALAGDGASWPLVGAVLAWLVLAASASSGRPLRDRLRWTLPPALRAAEYGGLLWIAAVAGALPVAFALLCAITFRHYDIVYRLRHQGVLPARALSRAAGGWDGRLLAGFALAAAGAVPEGFQVLAVMLAVAFVGESVAGWLRFGRSRQAPVYEDEEEVAE